MRDFYFLAVAKELPWFKWSPSKWDTGNIQMCSHQSKGIFADMCSLYWSRVGELPYALALQRICKGDASALHELSHYEIFRVEDGLIRIDFLDEQLSEFGQASDKRRKAAEKRWSGHVKKDNDASALQVHMQSNAIKSREEENIYTYGSGTVSIAIRKIYANEQAKRIFDLRLYFEAEKQLSDLEVKGWIHYQSFIEANAGRVFNDSDHLYNSYRAFCAEYKPPEASKKFEDAEFNKTLWTLQAWEKQYRWMLEHDSEFRKHFGYGELQKGRSMGVRDNGRGRIKGTSGAEG